MSKITVLGSYNQDLTMYADRFPRPKETLKNGEFHMSPGGKGANQAHAAAQLGGEVMLIAKLGDDAFGQVAKNHFQEAGIYMDGIMIDANQPTGCAMILVDKNSKENSIIVSSGANNSITDTEIDQFKIQIQTSDMTLFQFENPWSIVQYTMKIAKQGNSLVCLNPAPMILPFPPEIYSLIDILILNEVEALDLTGFVADSPEKAKKSAKILLSRGIEIVIITLGSKGVVAVTNELELYHPAFKVAAMDTTGAGDAFMGGFAVKYSETQDLRESLRFASATAALNVTKKGAAQANPSRSEVERFLNTHPEID